MVKIGVVLLREKFDDCKPQNPLLMSCDDISVKMYLYGNNYVKVIVKAASPSMLLSFKLFPYLFLIHKGYGGHEEGFGAY